MLRLRCGVDHELEHKADLILETDRATYRRATRGLPGSNQMLIYGILTDEQWWLRNEREKLTPSGQLDLVAQPGLYRREFNPMMGTRPCHRRRFSAAMDPWRQFYYESSEDNVSGVWLPNVGRDEVVGGQHFRFGIIRDPAWPRYGDNRDVGNLDRWQRSRIRNAMARVPRDKPGLYWLLRAVLAAHYGVPTWIIARVVGPRR